MKCSKCYSYVNATHKFCHDCGTKLEYAVLKYQNPYGVWEVTTEGDCEGRSIKNLGIYTGYVDEIAKQLAHNCFYSLQFSPAEGKYAKENKDVKSVEVSFNIGSGTWDMDSESRANAVAQLLKDRPVTVTPGQYYASFKINFK